LSSPPIVIDTCSFRDKDFIKRLSSYHGRKIISTITYAEMQFFLLFVKGKDSTYFDKILSMGGIEIEAYSKGQGLTTAKFGMDMGDFSKSFRDYAIASHASIPPWIVVTSNKKDFEFLNGRVMSPSEFRSSYMQ
jgi:predicted nucleic acid-binding protein